MRCCSSQGRCSLVLAVVILFAATIWGCGRQGDDGGPDRSAKEETAVTGKDVKREFDKAFDTTKEFLMQKGTSLQTEFEKSLQELERKADLLLQQGDKKMEEGKARAEETMKLLRQKQVEARKKFEAFRDSSAEFRDEAGMRMEKAYRELEVAYGQARERFDSQEE